MPFRAVVVVVVLSLFGQPVTGRSIAPLSAVQPSGVAVPISPGELHRDIALIVTDGFDVARRKAIHAAIDAVGGKVHLVYPPNVMIGKIPGSLHARTAEIPGIRLVTARSVDAAQAGVTDGNALNGVRYFNWVVSGEQANEFNKVKDIVVPLTTLGTHVFGAEEGSGLRAEASSLGDAEPLHHTIFPNDFLGGYTAVDVFFIESVDDPATPQNENQWTWTVADHNAHANRISDGFWFWMDLASSNGIYLTYNLRFFPGSDSRQHVPFEPILRNAAPPDDFEWISRVTANHGVTTGATSQERARAYGDMLRAQLGAQNGFPVFSPYNPAVAPDRHSNGLSAYAVFGNYMHLLYDNADYLVEQTGWVFSHEMGHIFWACDEYWQQCQLFMEPACSNCYGTFSGDPDAARFGPGPREAAMNWNCELCTAGGPQACIMHAVTADIWTNRRTCEHTRRQVGWPN